MAMPPTPPLAHDNPVAQAEARGWFATYFNTATIGFWAIHVLAVVGIAWSGWSWRGFALAWALYLPRMFFVTAAYHRYFSHRAYKTSRWFQFVLAVGAQTTTQKGVLWWASHHRLHHKQSDQPGDLHSVRQSGFWWSHMGWILSRDLEATDFDRIKDFSSYPELRWLNTFWYVPALVVLLATYAIGGWFAVIWGFALCQVFTWHGTFTINSLSHLIGWRRYKTDDDSRNNPALALLTLGEGWHNNHHHYQVAARQGFFWWEFDLTYYGLRALSLVGLVWDLHGVPAHIKQRSRIAVSNAESVSENRSNKRTLGAGPT
jgi:stearoyl-CoA desaturase (Delta-9 desaturase)